MNLVRGPTDFIRVTPNKKQSAGTLFRTKGVENVPGPSIGFWLADAPANEESDLCIRAGVVSTTKKELGLEEKDKLHVGYMVEARGDDKYRVIDRATAKGDSSVPGAFLLIRQEPEDQKVETTIYAIFRWG